jgi:tetratricopeptide (TPR) repeat protein
VPEEYRADFQQSLDFGKSEMEKSLAANSLDFRPYLFTGQLYLASYRFSGSAEDLQKADEILVKAIQLSPTNEQGYWYLAEVRLAQGRQEEAVALLQKASDLETRIGLSHWYLVLVYKITGQYQLALDELAKAELVGYNWKEDQDKIETVIAIYQALGQDPSAVNNDQNLIDLYLKTIENNPEDYRAWAGLAASYANSGEYVKAREAAQKVLEINPDLTEQIESFLSNLPQ